MATSLDLACPVPWPRGDVLAADEASGEHLTSLASSDEGNLSDESLSTWMVRRYSETLWLGEQHTSLVGFLRHVQWLEQRLDDPSKCTRALATLLRTRQSIRQRLSCSAETGGFASTALISALTREENGQAKAVIAKAIRLHSSHVEMQVVRDALRHGPPHIVAVEACQSSDKGLRKFARVWIDAMETREIQLQVLVILCLLQCFAKYPRLVDQQRGCLEEVTNVAEHVPKSSLPDSAQNVHQSPGECAEQPIDESPTQQKRRKRKVGKAHRWTGGGNIFPWQVGLHPSDILSKRKSDEAKSTFTANPQDLSKHFEAFVDALCLRVSITKVSIDVEADNDQADSALPSSSNASPHTPGRPPAGSVVRRNATGQRTIYPPFGSEGRKRESEHVERDVLQWFCCQVVEANFSKTLPRQCGFIRSRCFIPSAVTPAKMATRVMKREKSHQRGEKRSRDGPKAHLQQSLHNESVQNLHHTQVTAAAKRYTTWSAREVHVRRKWERSASMGPTVNAVKPKHSLLFDHGGDPPLLSATETHQPSRLAVAKGQTSKPYTLVPDTPAKSRSTNAVPPQRAVGLRSHGHSKVLMPFDTSRHQDKLVSSTASLWRRSESHPLLGLGQPVMSSADRDIADEVQDDNVEDGEIEPEVLDSTLRFTLSREEEEEEDWREENGIGDVQETYLDWLGPPIHDEKSNEAIESTTTHVPTSLVTQAQPDGSDPWREQEGEEEEERMVLSKRIRSLPPSSLWHPLRSAVNENGSLADKVRTSTEISAPHHEEDLLSKRGQASVDGAPLHRLASSNRWPTGRNPFADSR